MKKDVTYFIVILFVLAKSVLRKGSVQTVAVSDSEGGHENRLVCQQPSDLLTGKVVLEHHVPSSK